MFLQLHGLFEDIIPAESFAWGAARFCCWVVVDVLRRWRWTYRRASSAGSAAVGKLKYENKVFGCCVCGAAEGVSECVNTLDRGVEARRYQKWFIVEPPATYRPPGFYTVCTFLKPRDQTLRLLQAAVVFYLKILFSSYWSTLFFTLLTPHASYGRDLCVSCHLTGS